MKLKELYRSTLHRLGDEADARYLITEALGIRYQDLLLRGENEISAEKASEIDDFIRRALTGEPLQYIFGSAEFMGYRFSVKPGILIPRPETELLVTETAKRLSGSEDVLDLCCGSGCIGISLQLMMPCLHVTSSDISETAVAVTRENAEALGGCVKVIRSDLFGNIGGTFDCIVSNPPYIEREEIGNLESRVKDFEPHSALDGGQDGLYFYRRIITEAPHYLRDGGLLLFEIGYLQGEVVASMMSENGFPEPEIHRDYSGRNRMVIGRFRG